MSRQHGYRREELADLSAGVLVVCVHDGGHVVAQQEASGERAATATARSRASRGDDSDVSRGTP